MIRYVNLLLTTLMIAGCSQKSTDMPKHDVSYYRQHFTEAMQRVKQCKNEIQGEKDYTEKHPDCKDAFYVVFLDNSMESTRDEKLNW